MYLDPQTKRGCLAAFNTAYYLLEDERYQAHPEKNLLPGTQFLF